MSVDAEHLMVAGPAGGGKTTWLRELHAMHDGPSIYFTTKGNERKADSDGPYRKVVSTANYPTDIKKYVREGLKNLDIGPENKLQIIIDEAQNAPTFHGEEGIVKHLLHEERERTKTVIATQNPQDFQSREHGYGQVQQCEYWVFVGKAKDWHAGFLNGNGLASLKTHLPTESFEYVRLDPALAKEGEEKIAFRGRTNKKYG